MVTITGQSTRYYVHPDEYVVDLKQKISLDQGYSVADQNLIFGEKSLINFTTLGSCGVIGESKLTLILVGNSTTTATTSCVASHINPALSIGHLSLGLRLDSLVGGGAPVSPTALAREHPVSSHISRIVHVHDVPYEGFRMLAVYLYCRDLVEPQNCESSQARTFLAYRMIFDHLSSFAVSIIALPVDIVALPCYVQNIIWSLFEWRIVLVALT